MMTRFPFFNAQELNLAQMLTSRVTKGFVRRETAKRPDTITLVLASDEILVIRNRSVELQKFDIGVLDFELTDHLLEGSQEFELPPVFIGPRSVAKILTSYSGDEFEVGLILRKADTLPFIVVPGGIPSTLALFGTLNREHEWVPEFEMREYRVEHWA